MKKKIPIIGLVLGLCMLIFYPAYDFYYTYKNTEKVKQLENTTSKLSTDSLKSYFDEAELYNKSLAGEVTGKTIKPYEKQLNTSGKNTAAFIFLLCCMLPAIKHQQAKEKGSQSSSQS